MKDKNLKYVMILFFLNIAMFTLVFESLKLIFPTIYNAMPLLIQIGITFIASGYFAITKEHLLRKTLKK